MCYFFFSLYIRRMRTGLDITYPGIHLSAMLYPVRVSCPVVAVHMQAIRMLWVFQGCQGSLAHPARLP